jgi:hypothetical protein
MTKWLIPASLLGAAILFAPAGRAQTPASQTTAALQKYCVTCHSEKLKTAGMVINPSEVADPSAHAEIWEKVIRQLKVQSMPPPGMPRPDAATYKQAVALLESSIDSSAAAKPYPGDTPHVRRLTRTEYQNAIRDLLAVDHLPKELDFTVLLPADNAASGFDNIADLLYISPAVMERYLDASKKISRLAVGDMGMPPLVNIHRIPVQSTQDQRLEDLPEGTRGGISINSYFPLDGEYVFKIDMAAAGREAHQLEISIDGERKQLIQVGGGGRGGGRRGGQPDEYRIAVQAGPRLVGVTFVQRTEALDEATVAPRLRSRGTMAAISSVSISGPYKPTGPGETPSRKQIFVCTPSNAGGAAASQEKDLACAKQILSTLTRRAYRRPSTDADVNRLLPFYQAGRQEGGNFDVGIERALERLLVSPQFLYRIERDPADAVAGKPYRVGDLDLASRLSFFLWSSIPDDELLNLAIAGKLQDPVVLEQQVRRMMQDPRSEAMINNFAEQWLYLRDVKIKDPDLYLFRDFDETLRTALERETELFLDSIMREDRSVLDLLSAKYSFINERLARHYGIPNIHGSDFRRYEFPADNPRGGLLGQGSILTLTSYSTRTSPVLRGKYVLENLLASPPPPPPPNVPSLKTEGASADQQLTMRQAMEQHRANPACASCHARMDPIGFAMENFDAVGRWRNNDGGQALNVSATLPDGTKFDGIQGLKQALLKDPDRFAGAVAEKLLMYAVGRNVQYYDAPALRAIVQASAADKYRFTTLVLGVVKSVPFQMRLP